jgi:hypothetical protein
LASLATVAIASASLLGFETDAQITPRPGAMSLSANVTSLNNMMQTFVPIFAYYALNNQTYPLNIVEKQLLNTLTLESIHFNEATAASEKKFEYIAGTNKLHVHIGGFNLSSLVNANLHIPFKDIPFKSSVFDITNMAVDFILEQLPNEDGTHWKLVDSSSFTFAKLDIDMGDAILNALVKLNRPIIDKIVNAQLIPRFEKFLDWNIQQLNTMVANEGSEPFDFAVPVTNDMNLNMTMTSAPRTAASSDLIELFFDGIFDSPKGDV